MALAKRLYTRQGLILGIVGAAIALGVAGWGIAKLSMLNPAKTNQVATNPVPALSQRDAVVALGRLEPQGEVIRVGGPSGERIQRLTVKEGDFVQKGVRL